MSVKHELAEAVEALPESIGLEEAVERLYQAFKLKQARREAAIWSTSKREALTALFGSLRADPLERPPQGAFETREEIR